MNPGNKQLSPYSRYVGRVGAMAAALGIGVMVITFPGVAYADSPPSQQSSNEATTDNDSGNEGSQTGASTVGGAEAPGASAEPAGLAAEGDETSTTAGSSPAVSGTTTTSRESQISRWERSLTRWAPRGVVVATGGAHTSSPTSGTSSNSESIEDETVGSAVPEAQGSPAEPTLKLATSDSKPAHSGPVANVVRNLLSPANVPSTATPPVGAKTVVDSVKQLSQTVESGAVSTMQAAKADAASTALVAPVATALASVAPAAPPAPATGVVGILNHLVTNLLNPFLAPAPNTPEPVTPVVWAVLGWVRRNLFNQAPTITYNPASTTQTGQTVTGNVGATDPEGDALTYAVTDATQVGASTWKTAKGGTVTIDQSTGDFTYNAADIDYDSVQTDSFTVSVTDGKKVNLLGLASPRTDEQTIDIAVKPPTVVRHIVPLPAGFTDAAIPRFAADGKSLLFSATPPGSAPGARREIYQVNEDGTGLQCVTCGLTDPNGNTRNLFKPVPFEDGSGRILMQSAPAAGNYTNVIYDPATNKLYKVNTPAASSTVIVADGQREMRVSPDGTHVLFSQIQLVSTPVDPSGTGGCASVACRFSTAVPVVGTLTFNPTTQSYDITDARVVAPVGEGKQWTHDGKGVIVQGGLYDAGNVDDIVVDLATGNVTRLTGNLDYDEDVDLSPNNQWLAIDTGREQDMLLPASRIQRPAFVPLLIQGSVYTTYAGTSNAQNVTNQPVLIAVEDDLTREDGIPMYDDGDGWTARSMPSWSADGTQVAFWEANAAGQSRLVVADVQYTTSAATPLTAGQKRTPALSSSLPTLASNTPQQVKLPEAGTVAAPKIYTGAGGGIAKVSESTDASTGHIVRTVTYVNYVNEDGMILNGYETTDQTAAQTIIHYTADIQVTGTHTGYLKGDVKINKLTRTITPVTPPNNASSGTGTSTDPGSMIRSQLDLETQPLVLNDPVRLAASRAAV